MKKILLSFFALIAMVGMANAQRAWAYDLNLTSESESYTFTFKATTAATATLILSDEEGNNVGTLDLGAVVAGSNTFTYTTDQLPKAGKMNWAVKLAGETIAKLTEVTDVNRGIYNFYLPQDVAVDNNPESDYFGQIYVAEATDGASDGSSNRADTQKRGIFVYDQELNELNPTTNVGILPSNVTLVDASRHALHRMAVNPVDNHVAFAYNVSKASAVWCMDPANLAGEATDLIAGLKITAANSLCFDEEGALYVLCGADGGVITKIVNGEATQFAKNTLWANADNSLASDGKGGLWVGQNRYSVDANNVLTHVNSNGESDFAVNSSSSNEIKAWFSNANGNASYRGQIAYDPARQILAFGGNKKVSLFRVSYDENEVPTIEYWLSTAIIGTNIDGLAFDYAGDLYVVSATAERLYKYAVPTNDNTCTTPAPKAQVVLNSDQIIYTVTTLVSGEGMGTIAGANNYLAGESATLTATANTGYRFVNWTVGEETLAENPLTLIVNSDLTVTANFEAIPTYTITAAVNDENMGAVEGAGTYYEGEEVSLTATPKKGYAFVAWSNDATDNPLVFTATEDVELTANFEILSYTLTVAANDAAKGSVDVTTGTYEYGTEVTITATPTEGHEFAGWSNGSKANPLTITVKEDTELTANFRQVLATSITLNALPVQDYTPAIKGTIKRAVQNGENTIVLTHEADGTAHIYNIAHATQTVIEISQEGVNAAADGYLAISDIAVTDDGKLVACNYVHCTFNPSNTSYFYIWNDLAGDPTVWFTSQKSGNYNDAYMGYTMALKGTSQNAEVTISAFNKNNNSTRYSHLYVVDGAYVDTNYKYSRDNAALHPNTLGRNTYELNASPLAAGKWIVDGELTSPIEFVEKNAVAIDTYTALNSNVLGKKYNGASYLKNYNDHHLMVAPYANEEGLLAGVKVIGITDGFAAPIVLATNTALDVAVEATTAAATAVVDAEGNLTIHLFADAQVYTFTQKQKEPEYNVVEDEITNLMIDMESMCIIGGPSAEFGVDVFLALTEQNQDGTWALSDESSVAIQGVDATFIDGYAYDIDVYSPAVKVVLRVEFGGSNYELHIDMVSKPVVIEIADAIVSKEEYPDGMGGTYTNWTMDGQWSDGETTYPVLVDMPDFDPTIVEADMMVTITIGSWLEVMYGAAEGLVHATVAENVVTLTGTLTSYAAGTWEVTISGTLPIDSDVTTALDNIDANIAPVKAIVNGQLVITKDGVQYNAAGAIIK